MSVDPLRDRFRNESVNLAANSTMPAMQASGRNFLSAVAANSASAHRPMAGVLLLIPCILMWNYPLFRFTRCPFLSNSTAMLTRLRPPALAR